MAAVESKSDVELIEALDFEPVFMCEARLKRPCGRVAVWFLICRACGCSIPYCGECRRNVEAWCLRLGDDYEVLCSRCRSVSGSLGEGFVWVPIKAGA